MCTFQGGPFSLPRGNLYGNSRKDRLVNQSVITFVYNRTVNQINVNIIKYARQIFAWREKENNRLDASSTPFFSSPKIVRPEVQISVHKLRARQRLFFFLFIAFLQMFFYLHASMFNVTMKYHLVKKVNWILKNLKKVVKLNNVF